MGRLPVLELQDLHEQRHVPVEEFRPKRIGETGLRAELGLGRRRDREEPIQRP